MTEWVALLRGVNVNGITVKSAELRTAFEEMGLPGARTVLASGNVLFSTDLAEETQAPKAAGQPDGASVMQALTLRIERGLGAQFGYDAHIVLLSRTRVAAAITQYPFVEDTEHHAYVVFSSDEAGLQAMAGPEAGADVADEQIALGDGCLYWRCPKGRSTDTPFAKRAGSARFRATTTTRNLNTLRKLV